MQSFQHTVQDELGIHARPAGFLVKTAVQYPNIVITLEKDGVKADMKKLFHIMRLCVKHGDTVTVTTEGEEEIAAVIAIKEVFENKL